MKIFFGDKMDGWRLYGMWVRWRFFVGVSIVEQRNHPEIPESSKEAK